MTDNTARQPKGIPAGGQFAASAHAESGISLAAPPARPHDPELHKQILGKAGDKYVAAQKALREHDRLSMEALSSGIRRDYPTATELRIKQDFDDRGNLWRHKLAGIRDAEGTNLTEGDDRWDWAPSPDGSTSIGHTFRDIRKDFFENKHFDMGFGFFDFDDTSREIIIPLDRDYAEGIQ